MNEMEAMAFMLFSKRGVVLIKDDDIQKIDKAYKTLGGHSGTIYFVTLKPGSNLRLYLIDILLEVEPGYFLLGSATAIDFARRNFQFIQYVNQPTAFGVYERDRSNSSTIIFSH